MCFFALSLSPGMLIVVVCEEGIRLLLGSMTAMGLRVGNVFFLQTSCNLMYVCVAPELAIVGTIVDIGGGRLNKLLIKSCFILYDCSFIVVPKFHMSTQYLSLPPSY